MTETQTAQRTPKDWRERANHLRLPDRAIIDGARAGAASGRTFTRVNPATEAPLVTLPACEAGDVERAVQAARRCFTENSWRGLSPTARKEAMLRWARLIEQHREEIALLESIEVGKPISDTLNADAVACASTIAWYAEAVDKLYDEVAPTGHTALAYVTREPTGVVAAVIPWNYPSIIASWKIGPALAAGNSVILKPAEQASLACLRLGELAVEAGLPAGAFQVLPGPGEVTGEALGLHNDVDVVAFTGSDEIGRKFLEYSARSNMKRIWLECGGKSPQIVDKDCPDLDEAAEAIAYGIWYNQGETCHAGSRLIVHADVKEALLARLEHWAAHFRPGAPLDSATAMGPLVDADQFARVRGYIDGARASGGTIRVGGTTAAGDGRGYYVQPTIIDGLPADAPAMREEIFGPVLVVQTCRDLDHGIALANDTRYGLAASVWTNRVAAAHATAAALRAGTVWVNCYDQASPATPFGGFKESGIGRDRSLHAFDKFTEIKTTWVNLAGP